MKWYMRSNSIYGSKVRDTFYKLIYIQQIYVIVDKQKYTIINMYNEERKKQNYGGQTIMYPNYHNTKDKINCNIIVIE